MDASSIINEYLEKAGGPGSRGGKVLRILPNGKVVYDGHTARHSSYNGFSAQDHLQAGEAHAEVAHSHHMARSTSHEEHQYHKRMSDEHGRRATSHFKRGNEMAHADRVNGTGPADHAKALSAKANAHTPKNERENRAAIAAHEDAADAHSEIGTDEGDRTSRAHMDAARYYEDRKGQYEKSLGVPDEMRKSAGGGFAASVTGADILDAYLAKAGGEGSRGGKIIGHTKSSNKPIYAADHSANQAITSLSPKAKIRDIINATIRAHGNYSAKDHRDAGDAHEKASKRDGDVHSKLAEAHHLTGGFVGARDSKARKSFEQGDGDGAGLCIDHAITKGQDMNACDIIEDYLAKAGGEGSRGGKIIGHTRSGPVYAARHASHASYAGFSSKDHGKAGELHGKMASKHRQYALDSKGPDAHHHFDMEAHHSSISDAHFSKESSATKKSFGDGDGDHSHLFAAAQNADPDAALVRPVSDVSQSPLNDAIAATWPGMPFMAQASNNFCALMNGGKI